MSEQYGHGLCLATIEVHEAVLDGINVELDKLNVPRYVDGLKLRVIDRVTWLGKSRDEYREEMHRQTDNVLRCQKELDRNVLTLGMCRNAGEK